MIYVIFSFYRILNDFYGIEVLSYFFLCFGFKIFFFKLEIFENKYYYVCRDTIIMRKEKFG